MYDRIVVVTRRTRLEELIARFNTRGQARFYIEHSAQGTGDFVEYEREHDAYERAVALVHRATDVGVPRHVIDRDLVPTYTFGEHDVVVAVGQDGLVANVAKYTLERPLVGVNPDPERFDGVLLPFLANECAGAVESVLDGRASVRRVTLAEARLDDGQRLLAFNDLFIGARSHVSARYVLARGSASESQSSSGVLVATGAGSTGWISSVFNMAAGVTALAGGTCGKPIRLAWDDRRLLFAVREPFVSRHSTAEHIAGVLDANDNVRLQSLMPTGGVIFSDGVESDFLLFDAGAIATVGASSSTAALVIPGKRPRGADR
jgi:NAD kinase